MKKIFLLVFLVYFTPYCVSGGSASSFTFHENLPENRREEITIVDNHTVKVGLGPDQRSVSCTILDAVGSIPSIDGATEPDVVYVNKEQVHHIREGLYTWDRAGKYRVRLTTKYIREFGEIVVRVPGPEASERGIKKTESPPTYYQSLPENKREEITLIDPFMVEVGLGSDLKSIQSNIQDAIKSIPSVSGETFPEFVFVNGKPIFFIGNGLYSWNSDGSDPVRLTAKFIKKFGNIRVSIPGEEPSAPEEIHTETPVFEKPVEKPLPKKETVAIIPAPVQETAPEETPEEPVLSVPDPVQTIKPAKPSSTPSRSMGLELKGFRKAHFGMDISQVKKAIRDDFKIEDSQIKTFGKEKNIIAISTNKLSENGEMASVQYLFSNSKLARVNVLWAASENTDNLAVKLIQQFLSLRFLKNQTPNTHESYLYHGEDSSGNELKLSWAKMPNGNSRPLSLSYLASAP